jgi:hypothetical protein
MSFLQKIVVNKCYSLNCSGVTAFLILAAFIFLFIHSELGLWFPENHYHNSHDFCKLVDGSTTQIQKSPKSTTAPITVVAFLTFQSPLDQLFSGKTIQATDVSGLNKSHSCSAALYLANSLFLI